MTLKTQKFRGKIWYFWEINYEETIFTYFQKFSVKIFRFGQKPADFTRFLKNLKKKKKSAKTKNFGQSGP